MTEERIQLCIESLRSAGLYFSELSKQYSSRLKTTKCSEDLSAPVLKTVDLMKGYDWLVEGCMYCSGATYVLHQGYNSSTYSKCSSCIIEGCQWWLLWYTRRIEGMFQVFPFWTNKAFWGKNDHTRWDVVAILSYCYMYFPFLWRSAS